MTERPVKTLKALLLSLLFHGVIIVAVISCFNGRPLRHQEMVTVFLTAEEPGARASGKPGKSGGAAVLRAPRGASRHPAGEKAVPAPPPTPVPSKEAMKEKAAASGETTPSADMIRPPGRSLAPSPPAGGPGVAGGAGSAQGGSATDRSTGRGAGSGTDGGGSGQGFGAGTGSRPGTGQSYLKEHFVYIRDLILRNLTYPSSARRMGWQGTVTITFVVLESGVAQDIRIVKGSGYTILDQAVVKTVRQVQPFPKPPVKAELTIPIVFRLEGETG